MLVGLFGRRAPARSWICLHKFEKPAAKLCLLAELPRHIARQRIVPNPARVVLLLKDVVFGKLAVLVRCVVVGVNAGSSSGSCEGR